MIQLTPKNCALSVPMELRAKIGASRIHAGRPIPDGLLDQATTRRLIGEGLLVPLPQELADSVPAPAAYKGPWSLKLELLRGKSHEDLLELVLGIDPNFDISTLPDVASCLAQLTKDYAPEFSETVQPVVDSKRPKGNPKPLHSEVTDDALEEARKRARGL